MKNKMIKLGVLASALVGGAMAYKKYQDSFKKYNFADEIKSSCYFTFPAFMVNPMPAKILNKRTGGKVIEREDIVWTTTYIPTYDEQKIRVNVIEPVGCEKGEKLPCLLYFHGGGYVLGSTKKYYDVIATYANKMRCKVVYVHYRTMFEANIDACLEDAYSALLWLLDNAESFDIDRERIAVGGDSAGGGISSALTHIARDRKGFQFIYQMLIYPVVDSSLATTSMKKYTNTPGWNAKANAKMWKHIKKGISPDMMKYISPINNPDFTGLCDAYVEVEEYDCLHDEGVNYAEKLMENGYHVNLNDMKGTYHGFEQIGDNSLSKKIIDKRAAVLRAVFYQNLKSE